MNYRMLNPAEWGRLEGLIGGQVPPPEASVAAVAETDGGELAGVLFVQMTFHMEPLSIDPEQHGAVDIDKLHRVLEGELDGTPYFSFSLDSRAGKLCKRMGMKQIPCRVWYKNGRRA